VVILTKNGKIDQVSGLLNEKDIGICLFVTIITFMGLFSNDKIYGVNLQLGNDDLYKKIYEEEMNAEQINDVKVFFNNLSASLKGKIVVRFYTSCCTSSTGTQEALFMMWFPGNRFLLERLID